MRSLNLIDKAFLLKKTRIFGSLDLDLLLTISDKMEVISLKTGTSIFQTDPEAHRMYLVVEGKIVVQDKKGTFLAELSSGEFFGDEALFNEKPRSYDAFCKTDAVLLTLSRAHLLSIIVECPSVAIGLLEAYTAQIDFRRR